MKNKKVLSLIHLVMVGGVLASCGKNQVLDFSYALSKKALSELKEDFKSSGSNVYINENGQVITLNDPDDPESNQLQELVINKKAAALFYSDSKTNPFAETLQLSVTGLPKKAAVGTVTWTSSDTAVATVSNNGLVTAKKKGSTVITATSANGKKAESIIVVNNTNVLPSDISKAANSILQAQASEDFEAITTVMLEEKYKSTKRIDGTIVSVSSSSEKIYASVNNSYFRLLSEDEDILTTDGSVVPSSTAYVFYTTPQYHTYIFCNSDGKSNYLFLNQSYLIDEGKTSFDALGEVLQSYFVAGSAIMTNQFENIIGNEELTTGYNGATYKGSLGEGSGQLSFAKTTKDKGRVGGSFAQTLGVPEGTLVEITDNARYLFKDNLLLSESLTEIIDYEYAGQTCSLELNIEYYYQGRNVELFWPETKNYTQVESLFDL